MPLPYFSAALAMRDFWPYLSAAFAMRDSLVTCSPRPTVDDKCALVMNPVPACTPLRVLGLAAYIASSSAATFSSRCSAEKLALPMMAWMMADLSPRNSTCPCLASFTALPMSVVSVPSFGFGMSPRGPNMRATDPSKPITDGCPIARSKSIAPLPPFLIFSTRSSAPTTSAPAASASSASAPRANTATRVFLPVPLGRTAMPRTI
mmetsp:Transcript_45335/g.75613  ORF Transcript_45335/g.75613 Transcript_45335/m.75613 type:complete len:206 (-) Transcript_45335:657-1274(-)